MNKNDEQQERTGWKKVAENAILLFICVAIVIGAIMLNMWALRRH